MAFLATVDPIAFRVMAEYLASRWERFGKLIIRQALIRPPSFAGAVVAGFYDVITPNYPVKIFAELEPALEWLGVTNDRALLRAVTASREGAEQVDPVLRQLRIVLRRAPDLNLLDAATKLAVSPRTLQRKLMAKNTTFQNEVHTAKLQGAQTLMLAGGSSLTRIALELGFASLQHFSALFSKHYGHSPSSWLRQRVAGSAGGAAGAQSAQPSARLGHIDSDQQPIRIANDDDSTMGKDRIKPPALGGGGVSGDISIGEGVVL